MNISAPNRISYLRPSVYLPDGRPRTIYKTPNPEDSQNRKGRVFSPVDWPQYKAKCEADRASIAPSEEQLILISPLEHNNYGPLNRLKRMATVYPYRDMSWLVAVTFTFGSLFFVLYEFLQLLPLVAPSTAFEGQTTIAVPTCLTIGSTIFFFMGFMGLLAALNVDRGTNSTDEVLEEGKLDKGPAATTYRPATLGSDEWVWVPTLSELRTVYIPNIAFCAGSVQTLGGMIYIIAAIAGFPGAIDLTNPANAPLINELVFLPQVIGASLFLLANLTLMVLAQEKLWKPNVRDLTWHAAFWPTQGALGFLVVGTMLLVSPAEVFLIALAGFWGSWGFLIGAVVQWYVLMEFYVG